MRQKPWLIVKDVSRLDLLVRPLEDDRRLALPGDLDGRPTLILQIGNRAPSGTLNQGNTG